jgi:arylsulfate sulfotransferase
MVTVEFGPSTSYGFKTASQASASGGGTVSVLVAGMKQNTLYHMRAVFDYDGGQAVDVDHTFQAGAIPPAKIPVMHVTTPLGQTPTPGVQLVSFGGEPFAVNPAGDVVWYYDYHGTGLGPWFQRLLPNGHMLMIVAFGTPPVSDASVREIDLAGNTIRELTLTDLSQKLAAAGYNLTLTAIDHDVLLMPNGHWLFLTVNTRIFHDLPGYPGDTTVSGNALIDVDQNNNPVWVWDAFDHLDVNRHPFAFPDWTHANSLAYVPEDGNVLLSIRHQHWVVKIDYANGLGAGDIIWKLGHEGDFTLLDSTSPSDWFYAQHDANVASANATGDFQLALFDNGDNRVLDDGGDVCDGSGHGDPPCYSTAAIFEVNEADRTARRLWSHQLPYSFWGGGVQELTNSNIFVDETAPNDINSNTSRLSEFTQQDNPTLVWQLVFNNQTAYRAEHLPSLYPNVQW